MNENKTNINWFPGHMAKTRREIKERIGLVDIVINVIDARIPKSSFIPDLEELTKNKEKIIVMSKYDLCDSVITNKWKSYYESLGYKVILADLLNGNIKKQVINVLDLCMKKVNEKRKEKGMLPKKAKVMIIGVSNVGKSTLINKLTGKRVVKSANTPGVTKSISMTKINDKMDLIDTPGILWPKFESEEVALNLASMTIIKEEVLPLDQVCIHILEKLNDMYKDKLKSLFGIESFDIENIEEMYKNISNYKKIPLRNGEVDYDKINSIVINSIKSGILKGITFDKM